MMNRTAYVKIKAKVTDIVDPRDTREEVEAKLETILTDYDDKFDLILLGVAVSEVWDPLDLEDDLDGKDEDEEEPEELDY